MGKHMSNQLVSVIMPTFNRASTIKKSIESVLRQSHQVLELIVVDDESTDNTKEIIDSICDPRLIFVEQKKARQTQARRLACSMARGNIFAFCDSDDIWVPDYLSILLSIFNRFNADYVFTNYLVTGESTPRINVDDKITKKWLKLHAEKVEDEVFRFADLYSALLQYQPIFTSCQAITRKHYEAIGGISERINNIKLNSVLTSEDSHIIRLSGLTNNAIFINKVGVTLGRQGDNISHSYISNLRGGEYILNDILIHQELTATQKKLTRLAITKHQEQLALQLFYHDNHSEFIRHYLAAPKLTMNFKSHFHFLKALIKNII